MEINGNECLKYIKENLDIKLYPYQEYLIKCWFDGRQAASARGIGRSMCIDVVRDYFNSMIRRWNDPFPPNPDIRFDYTHGVSTGLLSDDLIQKCKNEFPEEKFKKELLCLY